jgi:hypothetical protein
MGHEIVYCAHCQSQIRGPQFDRGEGFRFGGQAYCLKCAPDALQSLPSDKLKAALQAAADRGLDPIGPPLLRKSTSRIVSDEIKPRPVGKPRPAVSPWVVYLGVFSFAAAVTLTGAMLVGARGGSPPSASPGSNAGAPRVVSEVSPAKHDPTPAGSTLEDEVRELESLAAARANPQEVLLRCAAILPRVAGGAQEARVLEIRKQAEARRDADRRDRHVQAVLQQTVQIRNSDPRFQRRAEVVALLRSTLENAGARRGEIEAALAEYERAAEAALAPAASAPGPSAAVDSSPLPSVTSLVLVKAGDGEPVPGGDPLPQEFSLDLARLPAGRLDVAARVTDGTQSVVFHVAGETSPRVRDGPAFTLAAGSKQGWAPLPGRTTIRVFPYSGPGGTGRVGREVSVTFLVIDSTPPASLTEISFQDGVSPTRAYSGTRDTTLRQYQPEKNLGADPEFRLRGGVKDRAVFALLRWDLTHVPPGTRIVSATLTPTVKEASEARFKVYALRTRWEESEATWTVAAAGRPWSRPGARGEADRDGTFVGEFCFARVGPQAFPLDRSALALVQSWVDRPESNFGILIESPEAALECHVKMASRESLELRGRPRLTLVCEERHQKVIYAESFERGRGAFSAGTFRKDEATGDGFLAIPPSGTSVTLPATILQPAHAVVRMRLKVSGKVSRAVLAVRWSDGPEEGRLPLEPLDASAWKPILVRLADAYPRGALPEKVSPASLRLFFEGGPRDQIFLDDFEIRE